MTACANWWDKVDENGNCISETWRKSTAISVPIVVVVVAAAAIVLVLLIVKKKICTKGKAKKTANDGTMRETVTATA